MRFGELDILESFLLVVGVKWRPCWEIIQKSLSIIALIYRSSGLEILSAKLHFHAASLSNNFEFMFIVWYILLHGPQFGSVCYFLMIRFRVCIFVRKAVEVMLWSSLCILPGGTQCWCVCPVTGDINCDRLGWFLPISVVKLITFPFVINAYLVGIFFETVQISLFSSSFPPLIVYPLMTFACLVFAKW